MTDEGKSGKKMEKERERIYAKDEEPAAFT